MPRRFFKSNPSLHHFGPRQSVTLPGSKTVPSSAHSTPKLLHNKLTSARNPLSLHSIFLAVRLLPMFREQTSQNMVNMQLNAFTLGLPRRKEHICSIVMSIESSLSQGMLSLRRLRVENKSPLTQIVMMRGVVHLQVQHMVIQGGNQRW